MSESQPRSPLLRSFLCLRTVSLGFVWSRGGWCRGWRWSKLRISSRKRSNSLGSRLAARSRRSFHLSILSVWRPQSILCNPICLSHCILHRSRCTGRTPDWFDQQTGCPSYSRHTPWWLHLCKTQPSTPLNRISYRSICRTLGSTLSRSHSPYRSACSSWCPLLGWIYRYQSSECECPCIFNTWSSLLDTVHSSGLNSLWVFWG